MRRDRLTDAGLSLVLALVVLGPFAFRRGFALRGDLVLVPHQPWKDAWLGLDGSVARFVPGDAILSVATAVVPGDLLEKALLGGALVLAGVGAGRLVGDHGALPRAAAIVVFCWNPWVFERLSIGQWGSVVGYAALPWLVVAARGLRDEPRRGWPATLAWLGFSALWSPAAGLAGLLTAFAVVVVRPRLASLAVVVGGAVVVNLPWLVPSLTVDQLRPTGDQFAGFAARGESGAGLLPSLLSFGGIWKSSIVPGERTLAVVVLLACVPTVVALVALRRSRLDPLTRRGLLVLAGVTFLLVLLPAVGPLTRALDDASAHLPALAAVRDSHRFLGPAVLFVLPGVAAATEWLWRRAGHGPGAVRLLALLLVAWPALCLPSMAWGMNGALDPVTYPGEWDQVATTLDRGGSDTGGATVVLPWHGGYRGFAWNDHRAMLDPAPRYLPGEVLIDDRLYLGAETLGNEDPRLARVTTALAADDPAAALRAIGVRHVLVEKGNGVAPVDVPVGRVVHDGRWLTLVDLGRPTGSLPGHRPPAVLVWSTDALAAAVLLGSAVVAALVAAGGTVRRRVYGDRGYMGSGRGNS